MKDYINTTKSIPLISTVDISSPKNLYLIDTKCEQKCHIDRGVQYPIHQQKVYTLHASPFV